MDSRTEVSRRQDTGSGDGQQNGGVKKPGHRFQRWTTERRCQEGRTQVPEMDNRTEVSRRQDTGSRDGQQNGGVKKPGHRFQRWTTERRCQEDRTQAHKIRQNAEDETGRQQVQRRTDSRRQRKACNITRYRQRPTTQHQ